MLAGKVSSRSDRFNVLGYQALHIHFCYIVVDAQKFPASSESFREIDLILMFGVFFYFYISHDC